MTASEKKDPMLRAQERRDAIAADQARRTAVEAACTRSPLVSDAVSLDALCEKYTIVYAMRAHLLTTAAVLDLWAIAAIGNAESAKKQAARIRELVEGAGG